MDFQCVRVPEGVQAFEICSGLASMLIAISVIVMDFNLLTVLVCGNRFLKYAAHWAVVYFLNVFELTPRRYVLFLS